MLLQVTPGLSAVYRLAQCLVAPACQASTECRSTHSGIQHAPHCRTLDMQDEYRHADGTCIAADFYHANELLPLSDEEIVAKVHRNLAICEPQFAAAKVRA